MKLCFSPASQAEIVSKIEVSKVGKIIEFRNSELVIAHGIALIEVGQTQLYLNLAGSDYTIHVKVIDKLSNHSDSGK